ncbi:hypothetical protein F4604DRAFT_1933728 [Suillus subluteus]|nr:hypothetical protein F4604DRAFT_1933728 [Suillus subluteus]
MQLSTIPVNTGPIYVYVHSEKMRSPVLRLLPLANDEPFHGLSSRFRFIGYAAHDYQLAPIYWPEEYYSLTHSSCNIVRQIGFLTFEHQCTKYSLYEIEPESSGFLEDICAPFCGANLEGTLCPIWVLDQLKGIPFNPAQFPNGFPPPAPIPIDFPAETPWNTLDSFSQQSIMFPEMLLPLSLDFDNDPTIDLTAASTLDNMFVPALDDSNLMNTTNFTYHQPIDEVQVPHVELHWRETLKDNPLDSSQKKSLKLVLLTSPWGCPIKLAKYLYVGYVLVGLPANPFSIREADCRRLITASFLRALHLDLKTYEGLHEEPLMVVNNAGSETRLGWSNLRNRFLETSGDFTSEMRKVIRGGTTPESGDLLNSGDQIMVQQAITKLIVTQGFRELLWASFFRPVVEFANGQVRLADLYPEAIQTVKGYLGKGIMGHNNILASSQVVVDMTTLASQQQLAALSDRGVGIWPTQLPRYAKVVLLTDDAYEDSTVHAKEISDPLGPVYGDWQELVHPLGGTYFYNSRKNTYTSTNLKTYQGLQMLDKFVDASRAAAKEDSWLLVVQPTIFMGREIFQYYYVVPGSRIITWLEDLNGYILFRECVKPSEWRHKRLELEAQYWKHFEFFLHEFRMDCSEVRSIWREMVCYLGEATTLKQSTAVSMFWSLDDMNHVVDQLAYVVRERESKYKLLSFIGNATATMLCMPITIERIRSTSIDGIINGVEVQSFIDDFGNQTRNQITLASIAMALDIAILAIPGLGATPTAQTLCSCSFLLGIGCIFAGTIAHHFGEQMRSIDFVAYYLRRKAVMLLIITSIPTFFCVLSVMSSILRFLTGITIDFKLSAPSVIACFATLSVVLGSLLVLVVASYGPGLAWIRPQ